MASSLSARSPATGTPALSGGGLRGALRSRRLLARGPRMRGALEHLDLLLRSSCLGRAPELIGSAVQPWLLLAASLEVATSAQPMPDGRFVLLPQPEACARLATPRRSPYATSASCCSRSPRGVRAGTVCRSQC